MPLTMGRGGAPWEGTVGGPVVNCSLVGKRESPGSVGSGGRTILDGTAVNLIVNGGALAIGGMSILRVGTPGRLIKHFLL